MYLHDRLVFTEVRAGSTIPDDPRSLPVIAPTSGTSLDRVGRTIRLGAGALGFSLLAGAATLALSERPRTEAAPVAAGVSRSVVATTDAPPTAAAPAPDMAVRAPTPAGTTAGRWDTRTASVDAAPASIVAGAPEHGSVRVVTVSTVDRQPRITTRTTSGRRAAEAAVAAAQREPGTVSVGVDRVLHAADVTTPDNSATTGPTSTGPTSTGVGPTADAVPLSDDADRPDQWALTLLRAEQTWTRSTGTGVTVAVIDTGVEAGHPDLNGTVLPGLDLVGSGDSADGSGAADSTVRTASGSDDENGHGTHVAGILAAVAGNGIGIAGLAPGVKILPVRALDADGAGYDSVIADGITQAVDHGASVLNLSLGGTDSGATATAVKYASSKGAVVVAAAGNERNAGNGVSYPAADPGVIGVAASTMQNTDASFSNTGSYVDLAAPGVQIWSTYKGDAYKVLSGTSMATPYVAAAAALVKSVAPTMTPGAITTLLERTATDLGAAGRDDATGYGLVDPYAAVCSVVACAGSGTSRRAARPSGPSRGRKTATPSASASAPPSHQPSRWTSTLATTAPPSPPSQISPCTVPKKAQPLPAPAGSPTSRRPAWCHRT